MSVNNVETTGKIMPLVIFLLVLFAYLSFPTKNYYWDGIEFARTIETASSINVSLLHPNHLFYNVLGFLSFQLAREISPSIRAIEVLQILNSIFGAASAVVFFLTLKNLLRRTYLNLSLTGLFAFSATWWKFSTDGGSYVPSIFFMLVSFYLVLPNRRSRPFLTAITHGMSMFFHQLAIFFFPVIILGIFLQTKSEEDDSPARALSKYFLTAFSLTSGIFYLCFYQISGTFNFREFLTWVTWYSPEVGFVFSIANVLSASVKSHAKILFDGRFSFFTSDLVDSILLVLLIVSVIALIIRLVRDLNIFSVIRRTIGSRRFYSDPVFLLCASWIIPYFLFLTIFIPGNAFYRLFYVPPVIILVGLMARMAIRENQIGRWRLSLLALIFFLANFIFFVHPSSQVRKDSPLSLAMEMNGQWNDKTIVYYDKINTDTRLVEYFNPASRWIKFDSPQEFEARLKNAVNSGETIWLDDTLIERIRSSPELSQQISAISTEKARFGLIDPAHTVKFIRIEPNF